jgi:hypothetical protein
MRVLLKGAGARLPRSKARHVALRIKTAADRAINARDPSFPS